MTGQEENANKLLFNLGGENAAPSEEKGKRGSALHLSLNWPLEFDGANSAACIR